MWAAIAKKGLRTNGGDKKGKEESLKNMKNVGGGGTSKQEHPLNVWKTGSGPHGNGTFKNGEWVYEQTQFKYRHYTNPAGNRQCQRQDGRIAVLVGQEGLYTSSIYTYPLKRANETHEEFRKRTTQTNKKRLHLLFCPEVVDLTVDPTLSDKQRISRFYKFISENYPEDFYTTVDGDRRLAYGVKEHFRDPASWEMKFDLEVKWVNPGVKIKIMENHDYGMEYLVTDEDFDVV